MSFDRRLAFGALPVAALIGGAAGGMLLVGSTRSVTAQDPARITREEQTTATSLENAFVKIADTAGPATVSITAQIQEPARRVDVPRGLVLPAPPQDGGDAPDGDDSLAPRGGGSPFFQIPPRRGVSFGSGVIVRQDGYILTNDHVVANSRDGKVKVTLADGTVYSGTVARDPRSDLAVVKIVPNKPLPFVRFANSEGLHVGQWAVAIGSPFGQQNTMTTGIVSALHRKSEIGSGAERRYYPALIQTDAAINRGNSGGPLLNIRGELIGINVAIYSPTGTSAGIGFAIPANTARLVMDQLISQGKVVRGSLGVVPDDLTPELRQQLRTEKGAYIKEVAPDTPADRAGIQPGDIVTQFNGKPVDDEVTLREAIGGTHPGTKVAIDLVRDGKPVTLSATLEELKADPLAEAPSPAVNRKLNQLGIEAKPLSDDERQRLRLGDARGMLVVGVAPGSPAAEAGLAPGLVITSVAGQSALTEEALRAAFEKAKSGDVLLVRVLKPSPSGKPSRAMVTITVP